MAFEEHLTVIRLEQAGNDLDGSGLAGAVGADISDDFAGADAKTDVIDRGETAVTLAQSV